MSSNWCQDIENVPIGPYKMITLMKVGTLDCENSTQVQFQEGNNENLLIWYFNTCMLKYNNYTNDRNSS